MRVKGGTVTRRKHAKVLKATKGYRMTRSRLHKASQDAYLHAGEYSYGGRKKRKNDMRTIWISRINAAVKERGFSYRTFVHHLREHNIQLNRHVLAELAVNSPETFTKIVEIAKV